MANRKMFGSAAAKAPAATARNEAGGLAYAMPVKHAIAQYAATATFHDSFYVKADTQVSTLLQFCKDAKDLSFIAKAAVYSRENAKMKDAAAYLLSYVWANARTERECAMFHAAFDRVVTHGKMLSNVTQMARSGLFGPKSLTWGSRRMKRAIQRWLDSRTDEQIFRQSVGYSNPSMADILRLAHPRPQTPSRKALYGHISGRNPKNDPVSFDALPSLVQQYERFKVDPKRAPMPNVPFSMLDSLPLLPKHWAQLAKHASWQQIRQQLETYVRHDVFSDREATEIICEKLKDRDAIKKANLLPYQLLVTYQNTESVPAKVRDALHTALEVAIENTPEIAGDIYIAVDVSGSMHHPVTGHRGSATSVARCCDVAALIATTMLRKNISAKIVPFNDQLYDVRLEPRDTVMTNTEKLLKIAQPRGTNCSLPLAKWNREGAKGSMVIMLSDNESWIDSNGTNHGKGTAMYNEWLKFQKRNPKAILVNIDLATNGTTQVLSSKSIVNIGGWSDELFAVLSEISRGVMPSEKAETVEEKPKAVKIDPELWVKRIEAIDLFATVASTEEPAEEEVSR